MRNYDYKSKMNQNKKRLAKRAGGLAMVAKLALSMPVASNVISERATVNLIGFNIPRVDTHPSEEYEETRHIIYAVPDAGDQITFNDKAAVKYIVQLPENLWNQLDADDLEKRLKGNGDGPNQYCKFVLSGSVYKKGETKPVSDLNISDDYNMLDNDLDLEKGIQYYDFNVPIVVKDADALYKDTYTLKLVGVDGNGVNLADVSGAYNLDHEVTEGEDAPEPGPEPEDPEVDKVELNERIDEAGGHGSEDYTDKLYALLHDAVRAAEGVHADDASTQDDVDAAIADIDEAIDGLIKVDGEKPPAKVDKVDLEGQLADIDTANLTESDYTEASWKTLQGAIKVADFVASDEEKTQEEIDEALAVLTAAYEGLEKVKIEVEEPTTPEVPEEETEEPEEEEDKDEVIVEVDEDDTTVVDVDSDDNKLPDIATSTFNWLLGGLMAMFAGGLGLFTRRGKKK